MQATFLPPRNPSWLAPMTPGRELGDCLVANMPLREWMSRELIHAGFDLVDRAKAGPRTIYLPIDDWVAPSILIMLGRTSRPTGLFGQNDQLLAWVGGPDPSQCKARMVTQAPITSLRYPWDLLSLNERILRQNTRSEVKGQLSPLAEVDGVLQLGKGSRILPGTFIEGNVIIGENCRIGPNAYLRGNCAIGSHCVIGHGVELKDSILYPHSSIRHYGYVGDSILGAHVHLGAGTVVSNSRHDGRHQRSIVNGELIDTGRAKFGTVIGDGVRTGVNTVIYPGRKIGRGRTTRPASVIDQDLM